VTKLPTSYRLSETAHAIIKALAQDMGSSQAQVIELAVRDLAKRRKIETKEKQSNAD
jgi:hypothetical protein